MMYLWMNILLLLLQAGPAAGEEPKVTRFPELEEFVDATYPPEAFAAGLEGAVGLQVDIDETGAVTRVFVDVPAGHGFDAAAAAAARRFVFTPAEIDGEPAAVRIGYTYHFKLKQEAAAGEEGQTIAGQVREKGVRLPIPGAEVVLEGSPFRQTTNRRGRFRFKDVVPGRYRIIVTSPGTRSFTEEIEVREGKKLDLKLYVEPKVVNEYRTVVIGKKIEAVVTKYTLETRTLETVPGTFGDPIRAVQSLPGIARTAFNTGFLVVRGAAPEASSVYFDGVQIPLLYHFLGGPSVLNPNFLQDISYYPGNFPARYGWSTAAVIDIDSDRRRVEDFGGEVDVNLMGASAYLETPVGRKVSARAAVRRSYVDAIIPLAMKASGEEGTTVLPVYWDYQASVTWLPTPSQRVSVFAFGSDDQLRIATTDEDSDLDIDIDFQTSFHRVAGEWTWTGAPLRLRVAPYMGYEYFTFGSEEAFVDAHIFSAVNRTELTWTPMESFRLTVGNGTGYGRTEFNGSLPGFEDYYVPGSDIGAEGNGEQGGMSRELIPFERHDNYTSTALYVEALWRPQAWMEVMPGFRSDLVWYPSGFIGTWDPRLTLRFHPHDRVVIKAGVGKFSSSPQFSLLDREYGNPDLPEIWADHYSLGVEWGIWGPLSLDLQGFFVRRHNQPVMVDDVDATGDGFERTKLSPDSVGRALGMELMLKYRPEGRFYGWVAYTLSRSEDTAGPETDYLLSQFDQTHILSVVGSVKLGRGWETGLRFRLISGNPLTPYMYGIQVVDQGSYIPVFGAENSSRLPPFVQLDFRVEKKFTFERWVLSTYLDVQNITNYANSEMQVWDYRFRESWNVPGIPIFPSIGVSAKW